ncbi:MAG: DUF6737 family protein [Potamolinea sp.]
MSYQQPLNPWNYKPWWCQPWSILLTGVMIVIGSWAMVKTVWVTVLVSLPIGVWWTYFLVIWPQLMRQSGTLESNEQSTQDSISQKRN